MPTLSEIIPARGAIKTPLTLEYERDLTMNDIARLDLALPQAPPPIRTVRAIHHRQAQLLAEGKSMAEVARIVGSDESRIARLSNDPAFAELVHYYRDQCTEIEFDAYRKAQDALVDIFELTQEEIRARLEDPDKIARVSLSELRQLNQFAADRSVAPPKAVANNVVPPMKVELNFGFGTKPVEVSPVKSPITQDMLTIDNDSSAE